MPVLPRRLAAFGSSARVTARLLLRGQLRLPAGQVDRRLTFADGSRSRVYRETRRLGAPTRHPALLVVRFRLRLVGRSRIMHALFRAESIANTPLFAGFPGFRSKLWATDPETGVYRGVYEWDGAQRAESYVTTLAALLRPVCVPGSVGYHIEPGIRRDDFLRGPGVVGSGDIVPSDRWWRLRVGVAA
jgi:hypothetical protein